MNIRDACFDSVESYGISEYIKEQCWDVVHTLILDGTIPTKIKEARRIFKSMCIWTYTDDTEHQF